MSFAGPNLARDPFVNLRPVRRTATVLWIAALALIGWNATAYLRSGVGVADRAAQLERLRRTTAESRARAQTLEADLRRADLTRANARTQYLNRRIDERAFSWNLLLDRLSETLPRGVRVVRLVPEPFKDERRVRDEEPRPPQARQVELQVTGEAEDDESLLQFVDRLFAHPAFEQPSLAREVRGKTGMLTFTVSVAYRPEPAAGEAGVARVAGATPPPTAPTGARNGAVPARAQAAPAAAAAPPPGSAGGALAAAAGAAPAAVAERTEPGAGAPTPRAVTAPAQREPDATAPPEAEPEVATEARRPAPRASEPAQRSIFGTPLAARPYASGGGR